MKKQYVGLIDCNNFFVSCERLFRPDLAKRPVLVLSSNDGCVVARSQEVKDIGIPMGVPYFQIKDIIKDKQIVVFSSNFTLYRDLSHRVFSTVKAECAHYEQYSIDEAFFHLDHGEEEKMAVYLRDKVAHEVGMPVSIGVAASKTLAKFASRLAKKQNGVCVLDMPLWETLASTVRLGELWGVGGRRARAFSDVGLITAAHVMEADPARIATLFGVEGTRLQRELLGEQAYPVGQSRSAQKSIMSTRSFMQSTTRSAVVHDAVAYHVRRAAHDLRAIGMRAAKMTVYIRSSRYVTEGNGRGVREISLDPPTDNVMDLVKQAAAAVDGLYDATVAYKKAGVILTSFSPRHEEQLVLFAGQQDQAQQSVVDTLEHLNRTLGADTVRVGSRLEEGHWQARRDALSPAYTTRWQALPRVRA